MKPTETTRPEDVTPGRYDRLSNEAYHASPGVSHTGLRLVSEAPARFYAEYLDPEAPKREPSWAMAFGQAGHVAILEPDRFLEVYRQAPSDKKQSNKDKQAWANFEGLGFTLWRSDHWRMLLAMRDSVWAHPLARKILEGSKAEISYYAFEEEYGELVKARLDIVNEDRRIIGDLKLVDDASPKGFGRAVFNFGWHSQAALYPDVVRAAGYEFTDADFVWIAVEKAPPYLVGVYYADELTLYQGRDDYLSALDTYHECRRTGHWPGYTTFDPQPVEVPPWITKGFR